MLALAGNTKWGRGNASVCGLEAAPTSIKNQTVTDLPPSPTQEKVELPNLSQAKTPTFSQLEILPS
jgi:hypothetical protein